MSYYYSFPDYSSYEVSSPESDEIKDALEAACRKYDKIEESNWRHQTGFLCEKLIDSQRAESSKSSSSNVEDLITLAISERPDQFGDECANIFDKRIQKTDITEITEAELEVIAAICHFRPIAFEEYTSRLAGYLEHYPQTADINKAEDIVSALWGISAEYPEKVVSELEKILTFAGDHCDRKISWPKVAANTLFLSYRLISECASASDQIGNHVELVSDCLDPELPVGVRYEACRLLIHSNADRIPSELSQLEQHDEYIRIPARLARLNIEASHGVQQRIQRKYREESVSIEDGLEDATSTNEFRRLRATHWLISQAQSDPESFYRYHSQVLEQIDSPDPDVSAEMIRLYTIIVEETTAEIDVAHAVEKLLNQLSEEDHLIQESVLRALCLFADQDPDAVMEIINNSSPFSLHDITMQYTSQYDALLTNLLASLASVDTESVGRVMNNLEWFTSEYFINWSENEFYATNELLRLLNRVNTNWQGFNDILGYIEEAAEKQVTGDPGFLAERLELCLNLLLEYYKEGILDLDDISPYLYTALAQSEKEIREITCKEIRNYQKNTDDPILTNSIIIQLEEVVSEESTALTKRVCAILRAEETIQSLAKLEELTKKDSSPQVQRLAEREYQSAPDLLGLIPDSLSGDSKQSYILNKKAETAPNIVLKSVDRLYDLALSGEDDALRAILIISRESPEEISYRALELTELLTTSEEVISLSEADLQAESVEHEVEKRSPKTVDSAKDGREVMNAVEEVYQPRKRKWKNLLVLKIFCNIAPTVDWDNDDIKSLSVLSNDNYPEIKGHILELFLSLGFVSELESGEQYIKTQINAGQSKVKTGIVRGIILKPSVLIELYNENEDTTDILNSVQQSISDTSPLYLALDKMSDNPELNNLVQKIEKYRITPHKR